jgi:2-polyprenyl-3-methyl-5-hydroxy-6-metoxy-1,4-benzoquinol methylase
MKNNCIFCKGTSEPIHQLNGKILTLCSQCHTVGVLEMPTEAEISDFYQGFNFQTNIDNYKKVKTESIKNWMSGIMSGTKGKMLDVGGGGGFFARAFEDFELGESTYLDIDGQACEFARESMGLTRVLCDSVENLSASQSEKYDFIYCRHVVEHLVDPVKLIHDCASLLSATGTLIIQCPNGTSKEGLLYPKYWYSFLIKTKKSNDWSLLKTFAVSLTHKYGWGIDPIRHLWAISGRSLTSIFEGSDTYVTTVSTACLSDPVFSPYWTPSNKIESLKSKFAPFLNRTFLPGMHLILEVRRQHVGDES